jgi:hypothetical protein
MGIYSDGQVYGVSLSFHDTIVFEEMYATKLTIIQVQKIKDFYNTLTNEQKDSVIIRFYTLCTSTCELSQRGQDMYWWPANKDILEKLFATVV